MEREAILAELALFDDEELLDALEILQHLRAVQPAPPKAPKKLGDETDEKREEREAAERAREEHLWKVVRRDPEALLAELELNQERWAQNFGRGALASNGLVDQRELDRKRGYFAGARYYLDRFPKLTEARLLRAARVADDDEGGDA